MLQRHSYCNYSPKPSPQIFAEPYTVTAETLAAPEKNHGPFFVTAFTNHQHTNGRFYNGYCVALEDSDLRMMIVQGESGADAFTAQFLGNKRVLIKVPSVSFPSLHDTETMVAGLESYPRVVDGINEQRNAIVTNPQRQFKYYILTFPVALDNAIFSPGNEDGTVESIVMPIHGTFEITTELSSHRANLFWLIAEEEVIGRHAVIKQPKKASLADKVKAAYSNSDSGMAE